MCLKQYSIQGLIQNRQKLFIKLLSKRNKQCCNTYYKSGRKYEDIQEKYSFGDFKTKRKNENIDDTAFSKRRKWSDSP